MLGANGVFWLVFAVWLVQSIKPLPTNAPELQDSVNYPVSQTSHLPFEAARSSVMWRIYSTLHFPAGVVSRIVVPSFRSDSTLFGVTLLVWRLVPTMLLSFGQWFLMAKALGWLLRFCLPELLAQPVTLGCQLQVIKLTKHVYNRVDRTSRFMEYNDGAALSAGV